jgi:hypothetical protein
MKGSIRAKNFIAENEGGTPSDRKLLEEPFRQINDDRPTVFGGADGDLVATKIPELGGYVDRPRDEQFEKGSHRRGGTRIVWLTPCKRFCAAPIGPSVAVRKISGLVRMAEGTFELDAEKADV